VWFKSQLFAPTDKSNDQSLQQILIFDIFVAESIHDDLGKESSKPYGYLEAIGEQTCK
jgi:hypothetical protein